MWSVELVVMRVGGWLQLIRTEVNCEQLDALKDLHQMGKVDLLGYERARA